ncbi:MAG: hypothetical protein JO013_09955 [Alphaproteobacteria bacterium]|nr:hypothetical protein [Alphaproteobacteria bacterium]
MNVRTVLARATHALDKNPVRTPRKIAAFRLDLWSDPAGDTVVGYTGKYIFDMDQGVTIEDYLRNMALNVIHIPWEPMQEPDPTPDTTSLSIRSNENIYIVIVIADANLQFASEGLDAVTIADGRERYYTYGRCAWVDDPILRTTTVAERPDLHAYCQVTAFAADCESDLQDQNRPQPRTAFNIYLNLRQRAANGDLRLIPFVFDPDVGYPGGHT